MGSVSIYELRALASSQDTAGQKSRNSASVVSVPTRLFEKEQALVARQLG
jgi:hypothetical protein